MCTCVSRNVVLWIIFLLENVANKYYRIFLFKSKQECFAWNKVFIIKEFLSFMSIINTYILLLFFCFDCLYGILHLHWSMGCKQRWSYEVGSSWNESPGGYTSVSRKADKTLEGRRFSKDTVWQSMETGHTTGKAQGTVLSWISVSYQLYQTMCRFLASVLASKESTVYWRDRHKTNLYNIIIKISFVRG